MSGQGGPISQASALVEAPLQFRMSSGGKLSPNSAFVTCPKCEAPCFIRRSERMTATVKHLTCHCTNSGCGHIFTMQLVFVHSLVEGNIDRPDLDLPVCPRDQVPHVLPPARDGPDDSQMSMFKAG